MRIRFRSNPVRRILAVVVAVIGVVPTLSAQEKPASADYDAVFARYRGYLQRPSLRKRTKGRELLAGTLDPRALDELITSYAKPEEPKDFVRYLIASKAMQAFQSKASPDALAGWRKKHDDAADAWMWFETLRYTAEKDVPGIRDIAFGKEDPFVRAAALEALAERGRRVGSNMEAAGLCLELLNDLPKKDVERALLIEAVASLVHANHRRLRDAPWKPVTELLIRNLDEESTPHRSKVVIARYLADALDSPNLGLEARWWLNELERKPRGAQGGGATTTVPFFSLRTTGYRFAYVIDASDSMLQRVTDRERKDLGPTTGAQKPEEKEGTGFVPEESDIDWGRVITRFDAAREYIRLSLSGLSEEHEFAIILFGDSAVPLKSTPRLVKASPKNIRAALFELERIEAGPPTEQRIFGQLLGKTNLHAGLRTAYELTGKTSAKQAEYVDSRALVDGADTLFVLTDGAPSTDDFVTEDRPEADDNAGDQETGISSQKTEFLWFYGPYAEPPFDDLVEDVRRLNLVRRAEIHCVGIGEANHDLMKRIAKIGLGQAIRVRGEGK
jgi:hypothetical protein